LAGGEFTARQLATLHFSPGLGTASIALFRDDIFSVNKPPELGNRIKRVAQILDRRDASGLALFGGYKVADDVSKVATAEKPHVDLLYLSPTRSRRFASLPEIEPSRSFRWSEVASWTKKILGKSRRSLVEQKAASLRPGRIR